MPTDPLEEWRRLTAHYSDMGDIEIQELADQINDLTPTAQQVLRDELKKRTLTNKDEAPTSRRPSGEAVADWEPDSYRNEFSAEAEGDDEGHHYTWKVPLCNRETVIEAKCVSLMLHRAGIDSWIEATENRGGREWPRVLVAADQLDQARLVAEQPIPQDILDEINDAHSTREYELPTCPQCGAPDPILESVEPSNNWLCESCDHTWSDPLPEDTQEQGTAQDA